VTWVSSSEPVQEAAADSSTYGRRQGLVIDVVKDYGAKVDGVVVGGLLTGTDDTTSWQAAINAIGASGVSGTITSSLPGISIIAGALQDTGGANAQLILPSVNYVAAKQITVTIAASTPPPPIVSVVGTTPVPDGHLILQSTLNAGVGGALLGGHGPGGFTNVLFRTENVTYRMPPNPVLTALNLSQVAACDIDNVVCDVGSYYVQGLTQPTTATSYGIRLPAVGNGAYTRLGAVNIIGFYTGLQVNEHTVGQQVAAWGCLRAVEFTAATHASKFVRLQSVHCPRGIVVTGGSYFDIDQLNIEHAASGWWAPVNDIDDTNNWGHGRIRWHVVLAAVGVDSTFTANGGWGLDVQQIDALPTYGAWLAYTPALTAVTTNPTLGTGSSATGRFATETHPKRIRADAQFTFGSSGANAGVGTYRVSLPAPCNTTQPYAVMGSAELYHAGTFHTAMVLRVDANTAQLLDIAANGFVGATSPWVWNNLDVINLMLDYEPA
jgi:hypothetical protein